MTKRVDFPSLKACLVDSTSVNSPREAGTIRYSEGDLTRSNELLYPEDFIGYYDNYNSKAVSVEIGTNQEKKINVVISPNYGYYYNNNYSRLIEEYSKYDQLVVYKSEERSNIFNYNSFNCYNIIGSDELIEAKIQLIIK
jgi:hypothetical protein